jgi:magnesium chelatase subunit ChlD-like protein
VVGQGKAGRAGVKHEGRIAWVPTLALGLPRSRDALRWQNGPSSQPPVWLVVVDASASTRRHGALARAKGYLAALFDQAYRERARLALLTASGAGPSWQRHALKASAALTPWLEHLGAGGGTPLREALDQARNWLRKQQHQSPGQPLRCLIVTDGRINGLESISPMGCETQVLDMELGDIRLGRSRKLARMLGAQYLHLDELPAAITPFSPGSSLAGQ